MLNEFPKPGGHRSLSDNTFLRNVQGSEPGGMWFEFPELVRIKLAQALQSIRDAALPERLQARQLRRRGGDDDLAALFKGEFAAWRALAEPGR